MVDGWVDRRRHKVFLLISEVQLGVLFTVLYRTCNAVKSLGY